MTEEQVLIRPLDNTKTKELHTHSLIVWNDDDNTFDWVIESLVSVCDHTVEQAEQCAWIIPYKGKYAVKHGSFKELRPMRNALTERGLEATVEE